MAANRHKTTTSGPTAAAGRAMDAGRTVEAPVSGGSGRKNSRGHHERIYRVVSAVPEGRVATYGQVAAIAGRATPRMVGYAMASLPAGSTVPWHRVINSRGEISLRGEGGSIQRALLEAEGVIFEQGRIDLGRYGWEGPGASGRGRDAS